MSFKSKRELLLQIAPRYREACPALKTVILDEFVAATGYARKYAIRLLHHPVAPKLTIERPRPPHYGPEVQQALHLAWTAANHICAKRLIPFLPTLVESLERHGHLQLSEECRTQLLTMSPAPADRILRPARTQERHGIATTRSGTLLKQQIPVRTFADWNDATPGFMEADLVAHCGSSTEGSFLYTLTLTDIATGWTECLPLLTRNQEAVVAALKRARQLLPFPLLGIDTDNGMEFINMELLAYCETEQLTFTRGRPKKSNDHCYVEQKNGHIVRQVVGYDRFVGELAYRQLTELYRALRLYVNGFQPSMKLQTKERDGSRVRRSYDRAQTPMQRLLAAAVLPPHKQHELLHITEAVDPLRLLTQLEHLQKALWRHALIPEMLSTSHTPDSTLHFSVETVAQEKLPPDGFPHPPPALLTQQRKRRSRRSGRPHNWLTRRDPFEGVWEEVTTLLQERPELTAAEMFRELERRYPDRWRLTQARTFRRGVQKIRARLLVTFNDGWSEEGRREQASVPTLQAELVGV